MQHRRKKIITAAATICIALSVALLVRAFETNQDARVVVGHDFFTQDAADDGLGEVKPNSLNIGYGAYSDGTRLFIADTNNHRVVIFNSIPTTNFADGDIFIGQPDGASNTFDQGLGGAQANTLQSPSGVFATNSTLFVSDTNNHRVLIYNNLGSVATNEFADVVVGQATMNGESINQGGTADADTLSFPRGLWSDGTKLFIADTSNNRVLIFNSIPTSNGVSADIVIGQTNFTNNSADKGGVPNGTTLHGPYYVSTYGSQMFVADTGNHRILIYDAPYATNASASIFVGQITDSGQTTLGCNSGGLSGPRAVSTDGGRMYVTDSGYHRVVVYNSVPANQTAANAGADFVLGQTGFGTCASNSGGRDSASLSLPSVTVATGSVLFIMDSNNRRVLIYDPEPTNQGDADGGADVVVGQPDMITGNTNASQIGAHVFDNPTSTHSDGSKLFVADRDNSRVLIWDTVPTANGASASIIIGQNTDTGESANRGAACASNTLNLPEGVFATNSKLYIADTGNHRVVIYNTVPATQAAAENGADLVIGQVNATSNTANQGGGVAANTLSSPVDVFVESNGAGKMYISDQGNNRVLIYNSVPSVNDAGANVVVGQANLTSNGVNQGAGVGNASANTLYSPTGVFSDSASKLFVADTLNNRVLIYDFPVATDESADVVVGQLLMTEETANNGGISGARVSSPYDVFADGSDLYVADYGNNRVLIFTGIPTANGATATTFIGQPDSTSNTADQGGTNPDASTLDAPTSVMVQGTRMFITDYDNHRALIYYPYEETGQVIYIK